MLINPKHIAMFKCPRSRPDAMFAHDYPVLVAVGVEQISSIEVPKCPMCGITMRPTDCRKCGSPIIAGHCSDETCPYSDREQDEPFTEE